MSDPRRRLQERIRHYLRDMESYARECLMIKDKHMRTVPLRLNTAQRYLHAACEKMLREEGLVRILVLKGRQQGISTYVAARFYRRATLVRGTSVFILAHDQSASDHLFGMVDRFQQYNPLAPKVGTDNAKELDFPALDSRYRVAIAGLKAGGRSRTNNLFHGSEVAWWTNPMAHFAASIETVPELSGTEIILETTANGVDEAFYDLWQKAVAGETIYRPVFIPWTWQPEYRAPVDGDFRPSDVRPEEGEMSEVELMETYGLTPEQIMWRRRKLAGSYHGDVRLFNQEYPLTPEMAFAYSDPDGFIKPVVVAKARKRKTEPCGPLVVGVDPSGPGGDEFVVCGRRGAAVTFLEARKGVTTHEAVVWIRTVVDEHKPVQVFVDAGGIGAAIISAVQDLGPHYARTVVGVNFGGKSEAKMAAPHRPGPVNRRTEMWARMRDWLMDETVGASIPDDELLARQLTSVRWRATSTNDLALESKQQMRSRGIGSPDRADALALTFASFLYVGDRYDQVDSPDDAMHKVREVAEPVVALPDSWML